MKVVCKNNNGLEKALTVDKFYNVLHHSGDIFLIVNDRLERHYVYRHRFYSQDELRDKKLKEIGI